MVVGLKEKFPPTDTTKNILYNYNYKKNNVRYLISDHLIHVVSVTPFHAPAGVHALGSRERYSVQCTQRGASDPPIFNLTDRYGNLRLTTQTRNDSSIKYLICS